MHRGLGCGCPPSPSPFIGGMGRWGASLGPPPRRGSADPKGRSPPPTREVGTLGRSPSPPRHLHLFSFGRMGPYGVSCPAHQGLVRHLLGPYSPPVWVDPTRWTPETHSSLPVHYRKYPKLFRNPNTTFLYINLYLQTIPELLVTSGISSGTPNNLR